MNTVFCTEKSNTQDRLWKKDKKCEILFGQLFGRRRKSQRHRQGTLWAFFHKNNSNKKFNEQRAPVGSEIRIQLLLEMTLSLTMKIEGKWTVLKTLKETLIPEKTHARGF